MPGPPDDLYGLLGVEPDVDARMLRAAYLARMRVHHPDRRPDDPGDVARRLNAAYEVLRDPLRRAEYDRARDARDRPHRPPPTTAAPRGARTVVDPAYSPDNQRYSRDLTRRLLHVGVTGATLGLCVLVLFTLVMS